MMKVLLTREASAVMGVVGMRMVTRLERKKKGRKVLNAFRWNEV